MANSVCETRLQTIMVVKIHHLGLDICLDQYNYHNSLRACPIQGISHCSLQNSNDVKRQNSAFHEEGK